MNWILRTDIEPGTVINEFELLRRCGVFPAHLQALFDRFQRFKILEKYSEGSWILKRMSKKFALELCDIRELFELRMVDQFSTLSRGAPIWAQIRSMREAHMKLLEDFDDRFQDFSELDSRFHKLISTVVPNRFIDDYYRVITLVFHYHYQWNKSDERSRNEIAAIEHLAYMDALLNGNAKLIEKAIRQHMASARQSLIHSLIN